ncbi:MAG: hypothetical protein C0433_20115 [Cyclobacterium sp.]|nr:hypothetical protein [Cyclobacterium sp.]
MVLFLLMNRSPFILLIALLFSCSQPKVLSENPLDYISDTTTIEIDRKTEPFTRAIQLLGGKLYWWNSDRETIGVFDLKSKKLINTIKLEREGPNGMGRPLGFFVHTPDSIYIPTMVYEVKLLNSSGKIIGNFDYNELSPLGMTLASMTRYSNMFFEFDDQLIAQLSTLSMLKPNQLDESVLNQYPPLLALNYSSGTLSALPHTLTKTVIEKNNKITFSGTNSSKSIFLLHAFSDIMYEIEPQKTKIKEHILKTNFTKNYSNEYFLRDKNSFSIEDNMRALYKNAENFGLTYDPHRELLYRFGWPGEEIPENTDPMQFSATPPYFVLSIYDGGNFELLGEFPMPRNSYYAHCYFVDEKGLNLFPMHPDNPEFNEDQMVIHTFDFSGLK